VTTENKAVAGRRELMGSRRALQGALRVNVLIRRGLRVDAESGPLPPRVLLSGGRPGFVRRLSGSGLRPEGLLSQQTPSKVRDGTQSRQWAVLVTVNGVRQSRKLSEKHSPKRTGSASAVDFAADRNRASPKREEGTGADHDPSSPVPQRTRDAFGCASLRGVDRPCPRP